VKKGRRSQNGTATAGVLLARGRLEVSRQGCRERPELTGSWTVVDVWSYPRWPVRVELAAKAAFRASAVADNVYARVDEVASVVAAAHQQFPRLPFRNPFPLQLRELEERILIVGEALLGTGETVSRHSRLLSWLFYSGAKSAFGVSAWAIAYNFLS
jgi:hypothetical protein